ELAPGLETARRIRGGRRGPHRRPGRLSRHTGPAGGGRQPAARRRHGLPPAARDPLHDDREDLALLALPGARLGLAGVRELRGLDLARALRRGAGRGWAGPGPGWARATAGPPARAPARALGPRGGADPLLPAHRGAGQSLPPVAALAGAAHLQVDP